MAKKNAPIEEPIEEVAVEAIEPTVESVEPTAEPINWLANGYPSRDFFSPIPGISEGKASAQAPIEEVIPSQDGGQE
jgi:hypothetical protein